MQALEQVVLFKVNAEEEPVGVELKEEFKVEGYPTFIVANADAETIGRWWGFDTSPDFIESLDEALADPTTISQKRTRFETEPTVRDAAALGSYHLTREEAVEAVNYLESAIELGEPGQGYEYDLVIATSIGVATDVHSIDDMKAAADRALASEHLSPSEIVDVVRTTTRRLREDDPQGAAPYIAAGLAAIEGSDDEALQERRNGLLIDEALLVKGDTELAMGLVRDDLPEGWEEDPDELNGFAWWCFENEVGLEEAEQLARRGAELAEEDSQQAMILDTVAEIAYLRGNQDEAATLIRQAIELAPESEYYPEQLDKFTGVVAEAD